MLRDVTRCQRGHCLLRDVSAVRGYTLSHRIIIKMIMAKKRLGGGRRAPVQTFLELVNVAVDAETKRLSDLLGVGSMTSLVEIARDQRDHLKDLT